MIRIYQISILCALFSLISCSSKVEEIDWPEGLSKGTFVTSEPLYLDNDEKTVTHGYDFYLRRSFVEGGSRFPPDIPTAAKVEVDGFISIDSYGSKSWYATGSIQRPNGTTSTFLMQVDFGYDDPKSVEVPWN